MTCHTCREFARLVHRDQDLPGGIADAWRASWELHKRYADAHRPAQTERKSRA